MRYLLVAIVACLVAGCASASAGVKSIATSDPNYEAARWEMCESAMCQHNVRVVLTQEDGTLFDQTFDFVPAVQVVWSSGLLAKPNVSHLVGD